LGNRFEKKKKESEIIWIKITQSKIKNKKIKGK